uniref:Glutamine amidotransferase domain-containing protein n=1 Tax=Hyaloperonospora arabidopsidis (strain Emoy2) TaxID=559515 RepID=M4BY61_HYAAE
MVQVTVLDYGAGNVRSLKNAIRAAGHSVKDVTCAADIRAAEVLIFPGVGNFRAAMEFLISSGYISELRAYVAANRRFLGICLGMQTLFEGSEECPELRGLGVLKGTVARFSSDHVVVPHIGWNGITARKHSVLFSALPVAIEEAKVYFVHSFRAMKTDKNADWVLTTTNYGDVEFISAVQKGNVMATQFHPEKSTECLDVRANDQGDLVVTKGDQYDVRESSSIMREGNVRNMGKPVDLCKRYFDEGADEVAFLNITSFREQPMGDLPMVRVLEASSECVFVPLTIGGGIRDYVDDQQKIHSALDVAALYFRSGADKVSIGSDAVYAAEKYYANGGRGDGLSSIETISAVYGNQAVVVSMDPKRVYVASFYDENAKGHNVVKLSRPGPNGEEYCWYQMTVRGGRETRNVDAVQLARAVEALGAGELLLNCVDMDGQKAGYDLDLISLVKKSVRIPVIASSGAGKPSHFTKVFEKTNCDAALAAGIYHRKEVSINDVKARLRADKIEVRL